MHQNRSWRGPWPSSGLDHERRNACPVPSALHPFLSPCAITVFLGSDFQGPRATGRWADNGYVNPALLAAMANCHIHAAIGSSNVPLPLQPQTPPGHRPAKWPASEPDSCGSEQYNSFACNCQDVLRLGLKREGIGHLRLHAGKQERGWPYWQP